MLMPLRDLRAIYEILFRDGVMVAKKDKRPQIKHPEVQSVSNLQVIRAMGSLKSRGYVKETFAWKHFYWYLTNDGIVYLRDYLHLPTEIVPATLQRIRKTPRFRGRPLAGEPAREKALREAEGQPQDVFRKTTGFRSETAMMEDNRGKRVTHQELDVYSEKPIASPQ
uniref:Plectin/eS10 N-terminal domain-containing protein n=1 Tax=Oreochromis aureus TaxID=47969 RepID=A0AAZ1XPX8_OREAU